MTKREFKWEPLTSVSKSQSPSQFWRGKASAGGVPPKLTSFLGSTVGAFDGLCAMGGMVVLAVSPNDGRAVAVGTVCGGSEGTFVVGSWLGDSSVIQ